MKRYIAGITVLLSLIVVISVLYFRSIPDDSAFPTVRWNDLVKMDYNTGEAPSDLLEFKDRMVKIPGYIVPLDDDYVVLTEFLLVPNPQACIHVPPPPPHLIVQVKLKNPVPMEEVKNPAWIYGKLEFKTVTSEYGAASYYMEVDRMVPYSKGDKY
ncbi:MAG: DUF3299 domain-containing protein [Bdellovibrionales bacterium]|nr:DUF3299 domain-containing protein [Bdellovibrionales bacterium]